MDTAITRIGGVVLDELHSAGYMESTIGEVTDDVVAAVLGVGEGQTGAPLPTVTAPRSCDTRYPPICVGPRTDAGQGEGHPDGHSAYQP
jgi:hypothetical protein